MSMSCSRDEEKVCFFPCSLWLAETGRGPPRGAVRTRVTCITVPVVYTFQLGGNQHAIMTKNCWHDLWARFHLVNPQWQLD